MIDLSYRCKYPEALGFLSHMMERLRLNDHKGHWKDTPIQRLLLHEKDEMRELEDAIRTGNSYEEVLSEAADVANMVMMVADNYKKEEYERGRI